MIEILPVTGLPEFRPGDDLNAALAAAAPWLRDGDVLVVTSKVLSKCEGRLVPAPEDPEARDALRRKLVDAESVRVLARKGRTLITENGLGTQVDERRKLYSTDTPLALIGTAHFSISLLTKRLR